jgi:hypothetical protein
METINLTSTINGSTYTILYNGKPWIVQDTNKHNPFPAATIQESVELHIAYQYLEFRNQVLNALKSTCNESITNGVDVEIDGFTKHFSLETYDQINIMSLRGAVMAGAQSVSYHADGEDCITYSAANFALIANAAEAHIKHHQTYYNQLKKQTEAMEDINQVINVKYGDALTGEYLIKYTSIMNS